LVKEFYRLTKPGIVYSNVLTAIAGYLLACRWHVTLGIFLYLVLGITLIIASACIFNNYIDRGIDALMERTQKRALASGKIRSSHALWTASIFGATGFFVLISQVSWLVALLGFIAYVDYIVLYGWAKRHTIHGTLVGTISGGASLVAGYAAYTNRLDMTALLLFLLMLSWQMPHFYAIAIRRLSDYKRAKIKVLPAERGIERTKYEMFFYCQLFIVCAALLTVTDVTGLIFLVVMVALGGRWLQLMYAGFKTKDNAAWAKRVFLFSLIIIVAMPIALALGPILP
jgi:protoheme IX farnesyltransferase